jgi:hypothetical protein
MNSSLYFVSGGVNTKTNGNKMQYLAIVLLVILIITLGPLLVLWSINTLFGLGIAYTFKNWVATLILSGVFKNTIDYKKRKYD